MIILIGILFTHKDWEKSDRRFEGNTTNKISDCVGKIHGCGSCCFTRRGNAQGRQTVD